MQNGTLSFSVFGIPVTIEPFFWLIGGLFGFSYFGGLQGQALIINLVAWMVLWLGSILIHELGHALTYRKFGGFGTRIHLYGMGGYATAQGRFSQKQSILITAAGPGVQIVAGLVAIAALSQLPTPTPGDPAYLARFLGAFGLLSILWAVLNLVPVLPLDGGRLVQHFTGSEMKAAKVGVVAAGIAAVAGFMVFNMLFAAVFFGFLAYQNYQRTQNRSTGGGPLGF